MSNWRTMDSAPKDGRLVDLWFRNERYTNMQWVADIPGWRHETKAIRLYHPDAWRPLPAAPGEQAANPVARMTPDQLLAEIADRLENSDPDVSAWAVRWADDVSTAIDNATPNPKAIAAALRALSQEGQS